jgi:methylglutaconyl-CoA hydratase
LAFDVVLYSASGGIGTVTLNRPGKSNALDNLVIKELTGAFEQCLEDPKIKVIILNANGDHFCAGADINWMQTAAQSSFEENKQDAMLLASLLRLIYESKKPVIALAHGTTLGGGLGLLAACDIALAADNAAFAFSEVKIGITPSVISPYVIRAIGERAARYYFITAERFGVADAFRLGLIHQYTEFEKLLPTGIKIATRILENSGHAIQEAKQLIQHVVTTTISNDLMDYTAEHLAKMRSTPEGREGMLAFSEKRSPRWR